MTRYLRQEAKALGLPTCYGSPCQIHPLLEGLRRVSGACVECARENTKKHRAANPGRTQAHRKQSNVKVAEQRKTDPVKHAVKIAYDRAYRVANKGLIAQGKRAWAEKNPGATTAAAKLRKHAKKQRTPQWLSPDDCWLIGQAYELATLRTKMFGFSWEVDHIVPLQGKTVSGLHVPNNIQVIPRAENRAKWNYFEVAA